MSCTNLPIIGIPLRINPNYKTIIKKEVAKEGTEWDKTYNGLLLEIHKKKKDMPKSDWASFNPFVKKDKWEGVRLPKILSSSRKSK